MKKLQLESITSSTLLHL
ncbi:hypothetical protein D039_0174A, partial [Vibrio parahaemolyticus EKP-028]